jgi:hypothetical protein
VQVSDLRQTGGVVDMAIAVALPVGLLCAALGLIQISHELVWLGPISRATAGWMILPLAWVAPAIGGAWWARLPPRQVRIVQWITFSFVMLGVALPLSVLTGRIGCEEVSPIVALPRMLVVGVVFATGMVVAASLSAAAFRGLEGWWTRGLAFIGCGIIGAVSFFVALWVWATVVIVGVSCAPTVT